jgi:hypothetical protein
MNEQSKQEFNEKFSPLLSDLKDNSSNQVVIFWKALNLKR